MVIRLERGADCLHMVQLMPQPSPNPVISCLIEIQTGFSVLAELAGYILKHQAID